MATSKSLHAKFAPFNRPCPVCDAPKGEPCRDEDDEPGTYASYHAGRLS